MATYVFVHGAWHGGWCWHRIAAHLQSTMHRVVTPDLISLGRDRTPPGSVTLAQWTEQITSLVTAEAEPVILVGHSGGGIVLSEVAQRVCERVRTLVYVTAFLLKSGQSLQQAATEDPESLVGPALEVAEDHLSVSIRDSAVRDAFYGQCSDADVLLARSLLVPEPLAPLATPIRTTAARYGRVPRIFVECTADRAITLGAQRRMQAAQPGTRCVTLDSDHSPFFSHSEALADLLAGF
jgi:pimeloyl-ACP methyl ester carboxylesterase